MGSSLHRFVHALDAVIVPESGVFLAGASAANRVDAATDVGQAARRALVGVLKRSASGFVNADDFAARTVLHKPGMATSP